MLKRKLFAMTAAVAVMTLGASFNAMAEYYVAPPENAEVGSLEFMKWEQEESKRWNDGLINKYAEELKKVENPLERFKGCVRAVADYTDTRVATLDSFGKRYGLYEAFRDGQFDAYQQTDFVVKLATEVGLSVDVITGQDAAGDFRPVINFTYNDTIYWSDAANYNATMDESNVASTTQFWWYTTQEQIESTARQYTEEELKALTAGLGELVDDGYDEDLSTRWMR